MASQAAASPFSFSPRPSQWMALRAAFSVARTNSNSSIRSRSWGLHMGGKVGLLIERVSRRRHSVGMERGYSFARAGGSVNGVAVFGGAGTPSPLAPVLRGEGRKKRLESG